VLNVCTTTVKKIGLKVSWSITLQTFSYLIPIKKHLEDVYFEREKALLPMTQELVVNQIRNERVSDARKWLMNEKKIILWTFNNSQDNIRRRSKSRWVINGRTNIPVTEQQWKLCSTNSSWHDLLYNTELSVIKKNTENN